MLPYTMEQVLYLLQIPIPSHANEFEIRCPNSNCGGKRFNINLSKQTCCCRKCGTGGGILDLYSFYTGKNRKEAHKEIVSLLNQDDFAQKQSGFAGKEPVKTEAVTEEMANADILHETYSHLLQYLVLAPDHQKKLEDRGFTAAEIKKLGYRSTPAIGLQAICDKMSLTGCQLKGVPGFFLNKENAWTIKFVNRGILIPVRDLRHRIVGIQVRLDKPYPNGGKYLWFSSNNKNGGTRGTTWTHYTGKWTRKSDAAIITEGPIKGDICNLITGMPTLAIPGVSSIKHLSFCLDKMKENGLQKVYVALDMDYKDTKVVDGVEIPSEVFKAYQALLKMISEKGITYYRLDWPRETKGIDDYLMFRYRGVIQ